MLKPINEIRIDFGKTIAENSLLSLVCENNSITEREKAKELDIVEFYSICKLKLNRILEEIIEMNKQK